MTVGENIRHLREERGLSREHLAELADLSDTTIKHCEKDTGRPRKTTLRAIAQALEVGVEEFYKEF